MSSKTPVYVAGLLLGVLPIGAWDISTTLSIFSKPFTFLYLPGFVFTLYRLFATTLYSISFTSVDFPEPDTPVTQVNFPSGNLTSIFFKLFSSAPVISRYFLFPFLLFSGTSIFSFPVKYLPVILFSFFITSSGVPAATTSPPCTPAFGPISTR